MSDRLAAVPVACFGKLYDSRSGNYLLFGDEQLQLLPMLEATNELGTVVLEAGGTLTNPDAAIAIAVGLAALGAGYAERGIGSAAVGAMAEDDDLFINGLILTVLPETIVILALVLVFVL